MNTHISNAGGGHGYLSRQYGLTIDNLLEVDVVLADGSFVTASEAKNADLFWALRGGGGNFGVITSFLFQARPVSTIFGGPIFFAQEDAATVMKWYRNYMKGLMDRKMSCFLGLKNVPSSPPFPESIWGRKICALVTCYDGPADKGEIYVKEITDALPAPIFQFTGSMPFTAIQTLFDPLLPPGMQWCTFSLVWSYPLRRLHTTLRTITCTTCLRTRRSSTLHVHLLLYHGISQQIGKVTTSTIYLTRPLLPT